MAEPAGSVTNTLNAASLSDAFAAAVAPAIAAWKLESSRTIKAAGVARGNVPRDPF